MMRIKGIIFDFDGTIFDSELPEYETWVSIFNRYDATLPISEWAKCVGSSNDAFDVISFLKNQANQSIDGNQLLQTHRNLSNERIMNQSALPGVTEIIQEAKALGLKLAIASSSPEEWVISHLTRLELIHQFDVICTASDVLAVKPDPELFICAANRLALLPDQVIVIEDSPHGITAAKRAGMFCVAVPNEITKHLDTSHANATYTSLMDATLEEMVSKFNLH